MSQKVGIIGSGIVGQTLANGLLKHGYDVMVGTNTAAKREELKSKTSGRAQVGSFEDAARFGELVVLATKGTAAEAAVQSAGIANLRGKTVIDTTNPIADAPPVNGVLQYFTSQNESLMERLQQLAPEAHFVKAFSCGNEDGAKRDVSSVLDQFGFDVADMGSVEGARAIEPLCILWCIPGFLTNSWRHAFKLLKQ